MALIARGLSFESVREKAGVSRSTYYLWKQLPLRQRRQPGRPKKMPVIQRQHLLRALINRDMSYQDEPSLWTLRTVLQRSSRPLSRQSLVRLLTEFKIHPGKIPAFPNVSGKTGASVRNSGLRGKIYLLEVCHWTVPSCLRTAELSQENLILWRLWGKRKDLAFRFSSDTSPSAVTRIFQAITCLDPTVVVATPETVQAIKAVGGELRGIPLVPVPEI